MIILQSPDPNKDQGPKNFKDVPTGTRIALEVLTGAEFIDKFYHSIKGDDSADKKDQKEDKVPSSDQQDRAVDQFDSKIIQGY